MWHTLLLVANCIPSCFRLCSEAGSECSDDYAQSTLDLLVAVRKQVV